MKCCVRCLCLLAALAFGGCSESTPPPSAEQTGSVAKQSILEFSAAAKRNPKQAKSNLSVLMESFDGYVASTNGPEKDQYAQIQATAKDLLGLYEKSAPKAEIDAKLEQLTTQANALPGR